MQMNLFCFCLIYFMINFFFFFSLIFFFFFLKFFFFFWGGGGGGTLHAGMLEQALPLVAMYVC